MALLLIAVFCGISATMVWNDFVDRFHDKQKGKVHALNNPTAHSNLAQCLWCISVLSATLISSLGNYWLLLGIIALCIVGLAYHRTYTVLGLSMLCVGVSSSAISLFAFLAGEPRNPSLGIVLFFSIALSLMARETLKDLEDIEVDKGYKCTIPAVLGRKNGIVLSGGLLLTTAAICFPLRQYSAFLVIALTAGAAGVTVLWSKKPEITGKMIIDAGMVATIAALLGLSFY